MDTTYKRINIMILEDQYRILNDRGLNVSGLIRDLLGDHLSENAVTIQVSEDTKRLYDMVVANTGSTDVEIEQHLRVSPGPGATAAHPRNAFDARRIVGRARGRCFQQNLTITGLLGRHGFSDNAPGHCGADPVYFSIASRLGLEGANGGKRCQVLGYCIVGVLPGGRMCDVSGAQTASGQARNNYAAGAVPSQSRAAHWAVHSLSP